MNTISKTHKRFSERLRNPRVLENPEEFLGENFEAVLNFWLILDELSEEQIKVVKERYRAFCSENCSEWSIVVNLAYYASEGVVGEDYAYNSGCAAYDVIKCWAAEYATSELIAMHKILENHQKPLTFFPMFLETL
jgi:hypothetical protein